jgi:multiple sugar transport system permease protein
MSALKRPMLTLGVVVALVVALFPMLYMVRIALSAPNQWRTPTPEWTAPIYTDSFASVWAGRFPSLLMNSGILAVGSTLFVMAVASLAAHAMARHPSAKLRKNVMFFALSTRMGPAVVFALPLFLMMTSLNLIDSRLGMLAVYVFYNLAFAIWLLHGFFSEVPREIEEAGLVDGLSSFGSFWRIAVPNALPGIIATATLVFILTWNEFFYALVLTRRAAATYPTAVPGFFGAFTVQWGEMFAASTLGIIPPLVFGLAMRRYLVRGLSMGTAR